MRQVVARGRFRSVPVGATGYATVTAAGSEHWIIGTAGHVDHGKSALIRALTGVQTDRLPEEQRRGISIDLGFAPFDLPSGRRAGVVDVPGHERFIHNMLAGVAGMDCVLLVVAADEGVMPQTLEHLDILDLVGVRRGFLVITKIDLVDDDWLDLVEADLLERTRGTFLDGAPVLRVSSLTGENIDTLRAALDAATRQPGGRDASGPARLPVDRVFTVAGFGTVVTGTLVGGRIRPEDRLVLMPGGREVRVRGLQVHGTRVDLAQAGQRVAVNLHGVQRREVERGDVLAAAGAVEASAHFSASVRVLHRAAGLSNNQRVHLHTGTQEAVGRVILLDGRELAPGARGYVRFRSERPLALAVGDPYVIRTFSPVTTIGGGQVLDPRGRQRRQSAAGIGELRSREAGDTLAVVRSAINARVPLTSPVELAREIGGDQQRLQALVAELVARDEARVIEGSVWGTQALVRQQERVVSLLCAHFAAHPRERWMRLESLRRQGLAGIEPRVADGLMLHWQQAGKILVDGERVTLAGHEVALAPAEAAELASLRHTLEAAGTEAMEETALGANLDPLVRQELLALLVQSGQAVRIAPDLYMHARAVDAARSLAVEALQREGTLTAARFRDLLAVSRRTAVPLLEYFDSCRVTRRIGDHRVLIKQR